jgi:hypothetical protein
MLLLAGTGRQLDDRWSVCLNTLPPRSSTKWLRVTTLAEGDGQGRAAASFDIQLLRTRAQMASHVRATALCRTLLEPLALGQSNA